MLRHFMLTAGVGLMLLWAAASASGQELTAMDSETAHTYGKLLSEIFAKVEGQQAKVEPSANDASGLLLGRDGIILVPTKSLDDDDLGKEVEGETGAPLAYLFMSSRFNPLDSDKPFDRKKLRVVKYGRDSGEERSATALILTLRHVEGSDWQMNVFGAEKKPLIKARIFTADDEKPKSVGIHVTDVKDGKATLVMTVLKKYEAQFVIGTE